MKSITLMSLAILACLGANGAIVTAEAAKDYDGKVYGSVQIKAGEAIIESGTMLPPGAVLTVTAAAENFVCWAGNVPAESVSNATVNIEVGSDDITLTPVYKGMWILDATSLRDAVGNWALRVRDLSTKNKTFQIGVTGDVTSPDGTTIEYNGKGAAYLSGFGELDLSTPICHVNGQVWKCTNIRYSSLGANPNAGIQPFITSCIMPKTLTAMTGQALNGQSLLHTLIMDCPNLAGELSTWFSGVDSLDKLVLKTPKLTKMPYSAFNNPPLRDTDFSEWQLESLTGDWGAWGNNEARGTLMLPNIQNLLNNCMQCATNLEALAIGRNLTVTNIGASAVRQDTLNLKKVTIGGDPDGWVMRDNSFSLAYGKLRQIEFLSVPPTVIPYKEENNPNHTIFVYFDEKNNSHRTGKATARTVCFYVSQRYPGWEAIIAEALSKPVTEEQAEAFLTANPGAGRPIGRVDASTFGTRYEQYVGYAREVAVKAAPPKTTRGRSPFRGLSRFG